MRSIRTMIFGPISISTYLYKSLKQKIKEKRINIIPLLLSFPVSSQFEIDLVLNTITIFLKDVWLSRSSRYTICFLTSVSS